MWGERGPDRRIDFDCVHSLPVLSVIWCALRNISSFTQSITLKPTRPCPTNPTVLAETSTHGKKNGGANQINTLKNKQRAIVFTDERGFQGFICAPQLDFFFFFFFTTEQDKSMKLSFSTPDCRRPPSTMLWRQRSGSFSSGLVPIRLTLSHPGPSGQFSGQS